MGLMKSWVGIEVGNLRESRMYTLCDTECESVVLPIVIVH